MPHQVALSHESPSHNEDERHQLFSPDIVVNQLPFAEENKRDDFFDNSQSFLYPLGASITDVSPGFGVAKLKSRALLKVEDIKEEDCDEEDQATTIKLNLMQKLLYEQQTSNNPAADMMTPDQLINEELNGNDMSVINAQQLNTSQQ